MTIAPLHPTHGVESTPIHDQLEVEDAGREGAAIVRDGLTARFAESIAGRHTCRELRKIACRRGVPVSGSKLDIAHRLAAQGVV